MEILVVLYFIDLTFGSLGQGRVTVNELARWFRVSKPTVVKFAEKMIAEGLIVLHRVSSKTGNGFIIKYSMTKEGKDHLDYHYDSAYELYRIQVAKTIAAINGQAPESEYRKLSDSEKRQREAGQKEMFS